ncbi:MAG TPA: cytochrome c [Steroidobacteraceae bacterium]|nr:cytochrome c [Steroidobacteraceae bacterium]
MRPEPLRAAALCALGAALAACGSASSPGTAASPGASAPATTAAAPASAAAPAALGAKLYDGNCVACHQHDARGIPGVYPSLAGSALVLGDPRAFARWVVEGERPASLPAGRYATVMPKFGWMKDSDVAALLTYLRSNFGNAAPAVDAATIGQALGD